MNSTTFKDLTLPTKHNWCSSVNLQMYVLLACQDLEKGGLKDKPGKSIDMYHTCYSLSGLWCAQLVDAEIIESESETKSESIKSETNKSTKLFQNKDVFGDPNNELLKNDPFYNICLDKSLMLSEYFKNHADKWTAPNGELGREGKGVVAWKRRFKAFS